MAGSLRSAREATLVPAYAQGLLRPGAVVTIEATVAIAMARAATRL